MMHLCINTQQVVHCSFLKKTIITIKAVKLILCLASVLRVKFNRFLLLQTSGYGDKSLSVSHRFDSRCATSQHKFGQVGLKCPFLPVCSSFLSFHTLEVLTRWHWHILTHHDSGTKSWEWCWIYVTSVADGRCEGGSARSGWQGRKRRSEGDEDELRKGGDGIFS